MLKHMGNIFLFIVLFLSPAFLSFAQTGPLEVWEIQGTTTVSPYAGQQVRTAPAVITAIGSGFFFMQSPTDRADEDALTSNGIYVVSTQAGNRKVGDLVEVTGTVLETDKRTQIGQGSVQITLVSSGNTLPEAVVLNQDFPNGEPQPVPELEAVEGMRVQFSGITSGPSDYRSMVPVVAGNQRPFREPGIEYPGQLNLPVWDGNPEIFWLLPNALQAPNNRFIAGRTPISGTGPLFQADDDYILFPETYEVGMNPEPRAVPAAASGEITLGCLNVRRFEESNDDFNDKARKLALYITEMLGAPDLLALQEVGSASALSTLRFFIAQQDASLEYTPFFLAGNDDIHLAYLAKTGTFTDIQLEQLGKTETLPGGGILFDRPPLRFSAGLSAAGDIRISVLNVHLRSLLGIEGNNAGFVREKRFRQSVALAEIAQELRSDNLLIVGDFNAYPFTDGYVDVVNQITGNSGLGALYPLESIVMPPLQDLGQLLPATERYSYVFDGSAQQIDHALAGPMEGLTITGMAFARANADFPDAYAPNEQIVQRASDHDGFVVYLQPNQPNAVQSTLWEGKSVVFPNPAVTGEPLFLELPRDVRAHITLVAANGQTILERRKQMGDDRVTIPVDQPGHYWLFIRTGDAFHSEKIVVLPSN
ncbi:endonuclease/exonuclease/phosphatase family protein [Flavilitoribacter nigricans]|uniref:Endonuclease/exonuclease/phosphatase domain-containing protein n=1 Tax=Flavilitoribacter nigricans (strain ATCC 23147 / DSM 23189 / NBRC 102662 / NCIMB 1420 / SS-2) TaxID=1122177 RepID=A0A2D0N481_FLAN2|nr:endonuclease/exonuclease/phosphatase family protein [Flavilitoribacter nigricans]PHN02949.1 hypothetical protein CRP01_29530 [Flavilitoribacter nigricans DSM 23189 = NBRC 102662]